MISYTVIGVRGVNGMITGAEVVKYVSALTALGGACQYMVDHFETVLLNMQYLHHYYEYLQLPDHKRRGDQSTEDLKPQKLVITFEDVSFRYPGCQKDSLRHINLYISLWRKNCSGRSKRCRKNNLDPAVMQAV